MELGGMGNTMWKRDGRLCRCDSLLAVLTVMLWLGTVEAARDLGVGEEADLTPKTCAQSLQSFAAEQTKFKPPSKTVKGALTYFLHVPRTGGNATPPGFRSQSVIVALLLVRALSVLEGANLLWCLC